MYVARSLGLDVDDIVFKPGQGVSLGKLELDTDPAYRVYPRLYQHSSEQSALPVHSFLDVYYNRIKTEHFKDRDVLIGITAPSLVDQVALPGGDTMAPLMITAHLIERNYRAEINAALPFTEQVLELARLFGVCAARPAAPPRVWIVTRVVQAAGDGEAFTLRYRLHAGAVNAMAMLAAWIIVLTHDDHNVRRHVLADIDGILKGDVGRIVQRLHNNAMVDHHHAFLPYDLRHGFF